MPRPVAPRGRGGRPLGAEGLAVMALQLVLQLRQGRGVDRVSAALRQATCVTRRAFAQALRLFDGAHQVDQALAGGPVFGRFQGQHGLVVAGVGE